MKFDEFQTYYEKYNRLPLRIYSNPDKKLNEIQLKRKYEKYVKMMTKEKKVYKFKPKPKIDKLDRDKQIKEKCMKRANDQCEIWNVLTQDEKEIVMDRLFGELKVLDSIHIIGRSNKKLRWDDNNIIIGMRYFHTHLDTYIDPITLKHMTNEDRNNWLIRIVGQDRWEYLKK